MKKTLQAAIFNPLDGNNCVIQYMQPTLSFGVEISLLKEKLRPMFFELAACFFFFINSG